MVIIFLLKERIRQGSEKELVCVLCRNRNNNQYDLNSLCN